MVQALPFAPTGVEHSRCDKAGLNTQEEPVLKLQPLLQQSKVQHTGGRGTVAAHTQPLFSSYETLALKADRPEHSQPKPCAERKTAALLAGTQTARQPGVNIFPTPRAAALKDLEQQHRSCKPHSWHLGAPQTSKLASPGLGKAPSRMQGQRQQHQQAATAAAAATKATAATSGYLAVRSGHAAQRRHEAPARVLAWHKQFSPPNH